MRRFRASLIICAIACGSIAVVNCVDSVGMREFAAAGSDAGPPPADAPTFPGSDAPIIIFDAPTFPGSDAPIIFDASTGGEGSDAPLPDAGPGFDAPPPIDAGSGIDASPLPDAPPPIDANPGIDATPGIDASPGVDAPPGTTDAGVDAPDAGGTPVTPNPGTFDDTTFYACSTGRSITSFLPIALGLAFLIRRRRRR